ncbi:MAG: hypothetical protein AB7H93_23590 [Vicinamibacterales bacterium]
MPRYEVIHPQGVTLPAGTVLRNVGEAERRRLRVHSVPEGKAHLKLTGEAAFKAGAVIELRAEDARRGGGRLAAVVEAAPAAPADNDGASAGDGGAGAG